MKSRKWVTAIAACLILLSPAPVVTAPVTVFDKLTFSIAANNATPAAPPRIAPVNRSFIQSGF